MSRKILFLLVGIMVVSKLFGASHKKGDFYIGLSGGISASNLLNSEAPHKMNIFFDDNNRGVSFNSVEEAKSSIEDNYKTNLVSDAIINFIPGIDFEYFFTDRLSIYSGLSIETKGLNLSYNNTYYGSLYYPNTSPPYNVATGLVNQNYKTNISNNYLIIPLCVRNYFKKEQNIFIEGGLYLGYLRQSTISHSSSKTVTDNNQVIYNSHWSLDGFNFDQMKYTNKFDYGVSLGGGYSKFLSDKYRLTTALVMNIGLRKLDAMFNNNYSETVYFGPTKKVLIKASNYYGLNSNSINASIEIKIGISFKLKK
ncbi:MAG: outer membrane beta-barrel protein [Bacteroidales bacterium]